MMIATHLLITCTATSNPSMTAIQSAIRTRRSWSHRPAPLELRTVGRHRATLPSWFRDPGPAEGADLPLGRLGRGTLLEERVDGRPGARDIGTERSRLN